MYEKELKAAKQAAEKASKILLRYHKKEDYMVSRKGDEHDIVTTADLDAEKTILGILQKKFPDYGIVTEEREEIKRDSDKKWLIDPLDGTHNFSRGSPVFGVSIALEEKGRVVLGVIHLPKLGERLFAVKGMGSLMNNKKIHVSERSDKSLSILFGGIRLIRNSKKVEESFLSVIKEFPSNFRINGCATYNLSFVASGRAEALLGFGESPWDIAAGALIVEEAGGKVTDIKGNVWNAYQRDYIASNGIIHKSILSCIS